MFLSVPGAGHSLRRNLITRRRVMKRRTLLQLFGSCLGWLLLLTFTASAQDTSLKSGDPELDRVQEMIRQAWQESEQFTKAGGKASEAHHPFRKWAATLWQYRGEHPGTQATARATSEALHLLIHVENISEMEAKADTLKPDDAAWKYAINVLMEAA